MWRYEILKNGELDISCTHRGTRKEAEQLAAGAVRRLNGDQCTSVWDAGGKKHNTRRAIERRRVNIYEPGRVLESLTIVRIVELHPYAKFTRYLVRVTCCGSDVEMTGQNIRDRERRYKANGVVGCRRCYAGVSYARSRQS